MSIWDKTLLNLQRGHDKLVLFAATFSERMRAEINIIRLRTQIDDLRERIGEQHRAIGGKLLELRDSGTLPKTCEEFLRSGELTPSTERLVQLERELENLNDELRGEARAIKTLPPLKSGDT